MPDERNDRLEELLEEVLTASPAERPSRVAAACERFPELAAELTALLESEQDASLNEFLDEGLPGILRSAAESVPESKRLNDTRLLRQEEKEERENWEGRFVGDEFKDQRRYEIVTMRRFGLMASLFFANDRKVGGPVVIKIPRRSAYLRNDGAEEELGNLNANIRNNFRREFDALRKLRRCSYVVRVLDFGDLPDGRPFMVQEFIEGENALELLNAHRESGGSTGLAFKDVVNIVRQAGKGLEAAHELSILHRDIKAENVMVTHDGHVKLIDFNAADVKLPISPMSTVFSHQTWGTLGYASPEQLQNMMDNNTEAVVPLAPTSDVYSLAVTAYQLLTGTMPFSSKLTELIKQQAACSFAAPSEIRIGVSRQVDDLFRSALNPDPAKRPQTVQEFATALVRDLEEVGHRPTEPVYPALPTQTRSRTKRPLLVIILIGILSAGGIFTWRTFIKQRDAGEVAASHTPAPLRSFSYWLDLTRVASGRTTDTTIRASGQEIFTSGDQFTVNFSSPQAGYLYLLNEGRNYQNDRTFYYIGKYTIKAGTPISSSKLAFDKKDGTEEFWFVFATAPIDIFEAHQPPLEISQEQSLRVGKYLSESVPADLTSKEDLSNAQTLVTGSGEAIAYKVSLRHRRSQ
jgi:serine/threonine protein kinase